MTEQNDDIQMDGSVEIQEVGSNNRMNHQVLDLFKKSIAVQMRAVDSERTTITGMAMKQLCIFAEEQLDALIDGLHRISLLQRRQSIAMADLDVWLRGYHLSPSSLYKTMEESNYIREKYSNDIKLLEKLLPKEDDAANTAFGRVIPSIERENETTEDFDDIDEDDYELVEYQQQAILQLFKTENISKRLERSRPSWLPSFPPDHTYKYTPSFNNVIHEETVVRQKLVEEGRLSEKALINLMEKFSSVVKKPVAELKQEAQSSIENPSITKEDELNSIDETQAEQEDIVMEDIKKEEVKEEIEPEEKSIKKNEGEVEETTEIKTDIELQKAIETDSKIEDNTTNDLKHEAVEENDKSVNEKKPSELVISEEELAELETKALLYRVENKKTYLIEPLRESLKNGTVKEVFENPTSRIKNFDVEQYAKNRVDLARRRVIDYEYDQLYMNYNPLLKLAKLRDSGVDPNEIQREYRKCMDRTMKRFLNSIPKIKEERKRVHKQAMADKEKRIRERLALIREKKLKSQQEKLRAAKEMEAIEKANTLGILPGEDTNTTLPQGAPLLIDPAHSVLTPQNISDTFTTTKEVVNEKVDIEPTEIDDVKDEELGLFGLISSDEDDYDNIKEEKKRSVTFEIAVSEDEKEI
ncbi:Transcription initiation factor TFIID subunit 8 [Nakaseomyces bracarensis]|uniref:Transcription initiation factor TFIID subunit 8 n=1 Tax=Nakaseomyces bracarensis TaxID=273131 RepID=A0ABR4NXS4_9SACH